MQMNREINVLVTAASRRVALIRGFRIAMNNLGLRGKVITTDMNTLSPGLYFSDDHYLVPLTTSREYIPIIRKICRKENIRLLIPTIDDELPIFGMNKELFAEDGILIPVSSRDVGEICNDKYLTYRFLKEHDFDTPETYLPENLEIDRVSYPLFLKPRFGRGSVGAYPINSERELRFFLEYVGEPIVQEFLYGKEYTIDVMTDFEGRVLSVVPRERLLIRAGVSDRGRTCKNKTIINLGIKLAETLGLLGVANFQLMMDGDRASIFEINPRFSGGIALTMASGADFPQNLLRLALGEKLKPMIYQFKDDYFMLNYEDSIFKQEGEVEIRRYDSALVSRKETKAEEKKKAIVEGIA